MISLKRNNKLELVPAVGMRTRQSSIYTPGQSEEFKISPKIVKAMDRFLALAMK